MSAKEAASIALFDGVNVLLIQRAFAPSQGHWSLPGGRLETGEAAEDCVRREIGEELGITLGAVLPVTVRDLGRFRLTVFAGVFPAAATLRANDEIAGLCWHDPQDPLPQPHTEGLAEAIAMARKVLG